MFRGRKPRIHFVGIGGIGMSGIAEVLLTLGYPVSGSDLKESDTTRRLAALGGEIRVGHDAAHVGEAEVVVTSSAVKSQNPEVTTARSRGIPVIQRAEMLAELMRMKYGVAVAGSHGKTTTTSLIATILRAGGLDPTAVIGGKLNSLGSNARLGQGDLLIVEADESDGSFLRLSPTVAVVTNIDPEHLDHWGTHAALLKGFADFVSRVPFFGLAVLCLDHPHVQSLLPTIEKPHVTYGLAPQADYRAREARFEGLHARFQLERRGDPLGEIRLAMPGAHNVLNALAAIAVADFFAIPLPVVKEALESFGGVQRRFTVRGEVGGVTLVDDYGHHPAEIRATLAGARGGFPDRRLVVAFQPHRYTRTRDLMGEFAQAFNDADLVAVTEVYAAGEEAIPGITGEALCAAIRAHGHKAVRYVKNRADVATSLLPELKSGDLVIAQGAGDIAFVCDELGGLLQRKSA
jgi:UDP-N-acetylmuramate--alanine ligase